MKCFFRCGLPSFCLPLLLPEGFLPETEGGTFEAQISGPKLGSTAQDTVYLSTDNQCTDWSVCAAGD